MIETDILVIGASPAGSSAAKHAALGGAEVILIDKKSELGNPKRYAEGIYDSGLEWLGIEPNPQWAVQRINGGTLVAPDKTRLTLDETILPEKGYIIERNVFDNFMAMDAASAGAKIMLNTLAKSILKDEDSNGSFYIVDCEQMGEIIEIKAKIIIAADGHESKVAKACGVNSTRNAEDMMTCVQYELVGVNSERMDLIELHLGAFTGGAYVWIFPKAENIANVGIVMPANSEKPAIEYLNEFISSYPPLNNAKATELDVDEVPIGLMIDAIYDDNLLVCGDAAGQVDPITGGGILLGMNGGKTAGKVAAKAIIDKDYSKERLEEYFVKYDEITLGASHKLKIAHDVFLSFDDNDLNHIIHALAELDYNNMNAKDIIRVFFKISPRIALKLGMLFKALF